MSYAVTPFRRVLTSAVRTEVLLGNEAVLCGWRNTARGRRAAKLRTAMTVGGVS
jgi:hypothetical protein